MDGVLFWIVIACGWLLGAVASSAAQSALGEASPSTIGDSFSGDDWIDVFLIIIWPVFWPCYAIHKLATREVRRAIRLRR